MAKLVESEVVDQHSIIQDSHISSVSIPRSRILGSALGCAIWAVSGQNKAELELQLNFRLLCGEPVFSLEIHLEIYKLLCSWSPHCTSAQNAECARGAEEQTYQRQALQALDTD